MSSLWKFVLCVVSLVALTGCQTTTPVSTPLTTVTVTNDLYLAPAAPLLSPPESLTELPAPPSGKPWPTNWMTGWLPLQSWAKYNGIEQVTTLTSNPHSSYRLETAQGTLALHEGTRLAYFKGLECWLGYPPQSVKGIGCVHWLDAQKVLQPLVDPFRFVFRPNQTIVLDPGHGGIDSGAKSSFNSHYEKEYTLDWAFRLAPLLEANGWKVVLTRRADGEISLTNRIAVANRADAAFFLSLHFNSGLPNQELAGVETYCLTPSGLPSSIVRTVNEDDLRQLFPNNLYDAENFQIALRLHASILNGTGAADRGVRRARFMSVLRGQNRPAVLLEGGYLSNYREAQKIASADYRQKLAEAVAQAFVKRDEF